MDMESVRNQSKAERGWAGLEECSKCSVMVVRVSGVCERGVRRRLERNDEEYIERCRVSEFQNIRKLVK